MIKINTCIVGLHYSLSFPRLIPIHQIYLNFTFIFIRLTFKLTLNKWKNVVYII